MLLPKSLSCLDSLSRRRIQRDASPLAALRLVSLQVDQIRLGVYPPPLQPQHFIAPAPRVERQANEIRQVRCLRFALRSSDVVCRAIWDSDATLNETGFDRLGTTSGDACAVAHNRLW